MLRYVITYGGIAGFIVISAFIAGFELNDGEVGASDQWLGYLVMLLALSLIFVGVRRYRDRALGGVIGFGRALGVGAAAAVAASVVYVGLWELYMAATDNAFVDAYAAAMMAKKEAAGLPPEALAAEQARLDQVRAAYANPFFRVAITTTEILPVGLLVALVTAAIVRTRRRPAS